ncbi:hypothetical protein C8R43DRAFT_1021542 [Mycena crocata]|nr:hypothetical protein C8R43DRAFT_1021542 [Mycena crocata]
MSQPPGVVRKKSLRIPAQLQALPIPPSLLQSPHLNSPQSIFRRTMPPRLPTVDDEWLQDTVPQRGAVKPQQETKKKNQDSTEQGSRRPSLSPSRPATTPGGRPALRPWSGHNSAPNISATRTPAAQDVDGYFVGY